MGAFVDQAKQIKPTVANVEGMLRQQSIVANVHRPDDVLELGYLDLGQGTELLNVK